MRAHRGNASPLPRQLHPPLVHAPIGAVLVAAVCDLVSVIGGASHGWAHTWFKGGSYALIVGTAALILAAASGFVDRARKTAAGSRERASASKHAAVMALMGAVCVVDLLLRIDRYSSAQHTPVVVLVLTLLAAGFAAVGGELGGRLVYRRGVGVQPRPAAKARPDAPPAFAGGPPDQRPATTRVG
jgi:uncharacterized membrane protein